MLREVKERYYSENDSIYNAWRKSNLETLNNGDNSAIDYFGEKTTFNEADKQIDEYAHGFNALREDPESSVTFSTTTLPSTMLAFYSLNKMGIRANFVSEPVLRSDGKTYLDDTNTETIMVLDSFYQSLAPAIAQSNVKNIVIASMLDGVGDPEEIVKRVRAIKPELKDVPTDHVIMAMRGTYGQILESGRIPGKNYYNLNEFLENGYAKDHGEIKNDYTPDDTAVILYTGGSTGNPKGVERTNEATNAMLNVLSVPGVSIGRDMKGWRSGVFIPPSHPTGFVHSIVGPWASGAEQVIQPVYNKNTFPQDIYDLKLKYTVGAPSHYAVFPAAKLEEGSLANFTFPYCGGEAVSRQLAESINESFRYFGVPTPLIVAYGMSEIGPLALSPDIGNWDLANKVGKPLPGMEARIVDKYGKVLGPNMRGKLEIKADDTRMKRYFNMPQKTAEFWTEDGFAKTDDIAIRDENGDYDVLGRAADMYTDENGETQYLFALENFIYTHPAVLEAEATKLIGTNNREIPVAHVVLKPEFQDKSDEILQQLKKMCDEGLQEGAVPKGIKFYESFPTNPVSNKRDYVELSKIREGFKNCDKNGIYEINFPEESSAVIQYVKMLNE